jgi:hypothetical protein
MAETLYGNTGDISGTSDEQFQILKKEFPVLLERIQRAGKSVDALDTKLDEIKAPWTSGRIPKL